MGLFEQIVAVYPDITIEDTFPPRNYFRIQNDLDGNGEYIAEWNHPTYPEPTEDELAAAVPPPAPEPAKLTDKLAALGIEELGAAVDTNKTAISSLKGSLTKANNKITDLETRLSALEAALGVGG
jgi:hypothetical protein